MRTDAILEKLRQLALSGGVPGFALSVLVDSQPAFSFSSGTANGSLRWPINEHTIYDIASITKIYTAALILRLHEKQQLDIRFPVGKYLPLFHDSTLTLCDLLAHRANFGIRLSELRSRGAAGFAEALNQWTPPPHQSPKIVYENLTYLHLGRIIEVVTGVSFRHNLVELIQSLGLPETMLGDVTCCIIAPPTEATDLGTVRGVTHDESARMLGGLAGNAGIFASAHDLSLFGDLWLTGKVISPALLEELVLRDYDKSSHSPQALGWWLRVPGMQKNFTGVYSHTGFTGCLLAICPRSRFSLALTCNRTYLGRNNRNHHRLWEAALEFFTNN